MLQKSPETAKDLAEILLPRITYPPVVPRGDDLRTWLSVSGLLVLVWAGLAWPWLSGQVTIPWDAKAHFHAQVVFLAQSLHRGDSPFWAPFVFGGHPQIADPQSLIFSPPHFILAMLTPDPTMQMVDAVTFLGLLFGAFGVLGFGRDRRWHPAAALVAAIAFAYGGAASWRIQHTGQIFSLIYFPWALWMLERALRLGSARYGALAGFFAALTALDPDQVAFLTLLALAGYVVAYWMTGRAFVERFRATLVPLVVGTIVGAAIIALPTMMVLGFAAESNRPHFSIADAEMGSLHPSSLLTLLVANLFGTIGPAENFWGAPSAHWPYIVSLVIARNMANFYMGVLPLAGIVLWLTSRRAYGHRFMVLGIMFVVMTLYALGQYTPLFGVLYHALPGVSLFRRPADSLFLVGALGAFLAGFGIDHMIRRGEEIGRKAIVILGGLAAFGFAASTGMAIWLGKLPQALPEMLIALAFIALTVTVVLLVRPLAMRRPILAASAFAVLLLADFGWNMRPNDSTGLPPAEYDAMRLDTENETIMELKKRIVEDGTRRDRVEIAGLGFHWPNLGLVHGFENTLGYNPLRLKHYAAATGAGDQVAGIDQHKFAPLFPSYRSPFANLMGLRFIAIGAPIAEVDPRMRANPLPLVARTNEAYIYENPDALPRVMVVNEAQIVDQARLLQFGEWPGTDFRRVAYIERTSLPLPRTRLGGTARITRYTNTEIVVETDAQRGGVLLLNDIWHPWWFAEIDGKSTPVLRANGIFRAVILPAGVQTVTFRFEPLRGLLRGLLTSTRFIPG
ncbi:MAG: hypothetical protein CTY25_01210 [Methylobacterium sp.]|nr:MAG: hypothetical protein CTY25_01210 [Methylobacterium sp.]